MGTLIAMHYGVAGSLADHTYVKCSTDNVAWAVLVRRQVEIHLDMVMEAPCEPTGLQVRVKPGISTVIS